MPKDPLELLKAMKQKEVVEKPVFRLSKPGQNNPLKMQSGSESEFAKAHNSADVASGATQAPPEAEDDMKAKYLHKIKDIATGLPVKSKAIPNYANVAISSFKQKEIEKEKFRNEEDRFKTIFPDPNLERTKRDVMYEHRMNEDQAIEFMAENDMIEQSNDRTIEIMDEALDRQGWSKRPKGAR